MKLSRRTLMHIQAYAIGSAIITACSPNQRRTPAPLAIIPPSSTPQQSRTPDASAATPQPSATVAPPPTPQPSATVVPPPLVTMQPIIDTPTLTAIMHDMMHQYAGFTHFADRVQTHTDEQYIYIESNGMANHPMMIGIRNWQQQVPIPQNYTQQNAWRVPLDPQPAATPISTATALYSGAIAIAVNGVPIFNALTNTGQDAYLTGQLDQWGGHSGRADDYHYHAAPLHLESIVGAGIPIAFALDGYAIYGSTEPDGSPMQPLDEYNGHVGADGMYHYHGTTTYPYINGGFVGQVTVQNDRIEPQPTLRPLRPPQEPLRGAHIDEFVILDAQRYRLTYTLDNQLYVIEYVLSTDLCTFTLTLPNGTQQTQEYRQPRDR